MTVILTNITTTTVLSNANYGQVVRCSGSTNYNVTVPTAVGALGQAITIKMHPALKGIVSLVTKEGQTIGGAAEHKMWAGESVTIVSDNTNWEVLYAVNKPLACSLRLASPFTLPNNVVTVVPHNQADVDNSGLMAETGSHQIAIMRSGVYRIYGTTAWEKVKVATDRMLGFVAAVTEVGLTEHEIALPKPGSEAFPTLSSTDVVSLTAGQALKHYALANNGATTTLVGKAEGDACRIGLQEVI